MISINMKLIEVKVSFNKYVDQVLVGKNPPVRKKKRGGTRFYKGERSYIKIEFYITDIASRIRIVLLSRCLRVLSH